MIIQLTRLILIVCILCIVFYLLPFGVINDDSHSVRLLIVKVLGYSLEFWSCILHVCISWAIFIYFCPYACFYFLCSFITALFDEKNLCIDHLGKLILLS